MATLIKCGRFNAVVDMALSTDIIVTVVDSFDGSIYNASIGQSALNLKHSSDCVTAPKDVAIDGQYRYYDESQNAYFFADGIHVRFNVVSDDGKHYWTVAKVRLTLVTSPADSFANVQSFK